MLRVRLNNGMLPNGRTQFNLGELKRMEQKRCKGCGELFYGNQFEDFCESCKTDMEYNFREEYVFDVAEVDQE